MASREALCDNRVYKNIIWNFHRSSAFNWYLTCQGWSTESGEPLLHIKLTYCVIMLYHMYHIISQYYAIIYHIKEK